MNPLKYLVMVELLLDDTEYAIGDTLTLPPEQAARGDELLRYGIVTAFPEPATSPPKARRRKAA